MIEGEEIQSDETVQQVVSADGNMEVAGHVEDLSGDGDVFLGSRGDGAVEHGASGDPELRAVRPETGFLPGSSGPILSILNISSEANNDRA